jgi:hypothetical protein
LKRVVDVRPRFSSTAARRLRAGRRRWVSAGFGPAAAGPRRRRPSPRSFGTRGSEVRILSLRPNNSVISISKGRPPAAISAAGQICGLKPAGEPKDAHPSEVPLWAKRLSESRHRAAASAFGAFWRHCPTRGHPRGEGRVHSPQGPRSGPQARKTGDTPPPARPSSRASPFRARGAKPLSPLSVDS